MPKYAAREAAAHLETDPAQLRALARSRRLWRTLATNPGAPADLLEDLFANGDSGVHAALAANPNTPTELLAQLVIHHPREFLENPVVPLLLIVEPDFIKRLTVEGQLTLLSQAQTPPAIVRTIASLGATSVRAAALHHVGLVGEAGADWYAEALRQIALTVNLTEADNDLIALPELLAADQLRTLAVHPRFAWALAKAPETPADVLLTLAQHPDRDARRWVAEHPQSPAAALVALASDQEGSVRRVVATHPHTPPDALDLLALDAVSDIRTLVARHPALSSAAQGLLALDRPDVRAALAKRSNLAPELFDALVADVDPTVRFELAANSHLAAEQIARLADDPFINIRAQVARHPALPLAVYQQMQHDGQPLVQAALVTSPHQPFKSLMRLARSDDPIILEAVASNPRMPDDVLESIGEVVSRQMGNLGVRADSDWLRVGQALACHPNTTVHTLELLINTRQLAWYPLIAAHPRASSTLLRRFTWAWGDQEMMDANRRQQIDAALVAAVRHPRVAFRTLSTLALANLTVCRAAVQHPRVTADRRRGLFIALCTSIIEGRSALPVPLRPARRTVEFVALQAHLPLPYAESLSSSLDWVERFTLACQRPTTPATLQRLAEDGNRYVRAAARAQLAALPTLPLSNSAPLAHTDE